MKILVTGSNGLLGQKLVLKLAENKDVDLVATARGENRLSYTEGYTYASLDITNRDEAMDVITQHKPDVVINTAAMTNVDACEKDQEGCDDLNVKAVEYLIEACNQAEAHLLHLSTDFIFDGADGPYSEEAVPNPLSYYGRSKLTSEKLVEEHAKSWAIARTVLVYGVADKMSRSNIVLWAKGALEKGSPISVVNDQWRTPTLAEDLADGCIAIALKKAVGYYNLSGDDFMCIDELVKRVAAFWKLDDSIMSTVSSETLNQPAKRPPRTGFILDKAKMDLGYKPHTFEEGLAVVDEQLKKYQEIS